MNKFYKVSYEQYRMDLMQSRVKDTLPPDVEFNDIEETYKDLIIPTRSTKHSAGYDFRSPITFDVKANEKYILPTGIKCEMSEDKVLLCFPRSSYGFKYGFRLLNSTGVIDSDYYNNKDNEGHIMLGFMTDKDMVIKKGDKLFQAVITKFYTTEDDDSKEDRKGGIGSTGV